EPRRGDDLQHELHQRDDEQIDRERDEADPEAGGMHRARSGLVHGAYNTRMISVRDGQAQILARIDAPLAAELVPLTRALGRVLSEDYAAPFDVPPADNSAGDGHPGCHADLPPPVTRDPP